MMHKQIVSQTPGCIVYRGQREGEVLYSFTDTYVCPYSQETHVIPGRGALAHRISAFFFSKLRHIHIPSHFVRSLNMRESLMYYTQLLPFGSLIRCAATEDFAKRFNICTDQPFERPIIDYRHHESRQLVSESHLLACQWISPDGLDELQMLILRCVDFLRGVMIGVGLDLIELELHFGQNFSADGQELFFISGELSPEKFSVMDLETGEKFGHSYLFTTSAQPITHYRHIAHKLGLHIGPIPFQNTIP